MKGTQSDIALRIGNLEQNPIAIAVKEKIMEMMYDDLEKAEIREVIKEAYPGFPEHLFEECYTDAFTSI